MIEVPARVKDALKSGDYRKNYKVNVYLKTDTHEYKSPEISIYYEEGPLGGFWRSSSFSITLEEYCRNVVLEINSEHITSVDWDNYMISFNAFPDRFEIKDGKTYVTISNYVDPIYHTGFNVNAGTHSCWVEADIESVSPDFSSIIKQANYGIVIDNNHLVSESMKFDERMCSDTELKFGLCEGTSVEFQYFDEMNIRDHQIFIELDVEYKNADGNLAWYTIPMGWFQVDECSRQASTGIIKATAYNKLKSAYLDVNQNAAITEIIKNSGGQTASVNRILATLLGDYSIIYDETIPVRVKPLEYYRSWESEGWDKIFNGYELRIYNSNGTEYEPSPGYEKPTGRYFTFFMAKFLLAPEGESGDSSTFSYGFVFFLKKLWDTVLQPVFYNYLLDNIFVDFYDDYPEFKLKINNDFYLPEEYAQQADSDVRVAGKISWYGDEIVRLGTYKDTETYDTGTFIGDFPVIEVPVLVTTNLLTKPDYTIDGIDTFYSDQNNFIKNDLINRHSEILSLLNNAIAEAYQSDSIARTYLTLSDIGTNSITLRDLQTAVFEADIQYGKLDRVTDVFSGVELNHGGLYPRDNLYPSDTLFPQGDSESGYPAMYSKLWADEGNVRSFRNLIITYRTTVNNSQEDATLTRVVDANGTDDYYMDDNWLFKNLSWTAQQVGVFADMMVPKLQKIRWFPFEMWCAGLPYLESGDAIEIRMKDGTYPSYVLRRVLNGIQNLQDEMINGTLDIF